MPNWPTENTHVVPAKPVKYQNGIAEFNVNQLFNDENDEALTVYIDQRPKGNS